MKKSFKIPNRAELAITMTCVVGFISVLVLGVAVHLLGRPLNWCNDVTLLMLAWTAFLGDDMAFRVDRMVNVDTLVARLPVGSQKAVAVMVYVVLLVMIFMMVKQGALLCVNMSKKTLEGISFLSHVWVAASISVDFSLMFVTAARRLYDLMMSSNITVISKM